MTLCLQRSLWSEYQNLIERNKLSLIGRVTNPYIQKTRALVDFFLQHWNVVGRITCRDLGPTLFQFNFESEKDMQTILSKLPYHFKKWMMILQRWEPIVSETFPASIPFWINIHGIPLHYWNEGTMNAIGDALGPVETKIVDKARLRFFVNGLKPLIMRMDIELPSKAVVEVEFEYEGLQKHCFLCKALSHEEDDCPNRASSRYPMGPKRDMGISQLNTLEKIEDSKRRQEERRTARAQIPQQTGARWTNYRNADARSYRSSSRDVSSKRNSERSSGFEENRRRFDDRALPRHVSPSLSRRTPPRRDSQDHGSTGYVARERSLRASDDRDLRESLSKEANSKSYLSPRISLSYVRRFSPDFVRRRNSREK